MLTTTSVLSHLHHEVRGCGPPVALIVGPGRDAGHRTRTAARLGSPRGPRPFAEQLRPILRGL